SCTKLGFLAAFFFSSRRRHTRSDRDWSSDVCSSDLSGLARVLYVVDALAVRRPGHHDALARPRCAVLDTRPAVSAIVSRRQVQRSEERRVGKEGRYRRGLGWGKKMIEVWNVGSEIGP